MSVAHNEQPLHGQRHEHGHNEEKPHQHSHSHAIPLEGNGKVGLIFRFSVLATALFVLLEFGAGIWANSLALISDAGHNLTDAMALAFSWWALSMARRSPNFNKTYGYHRAGILAASFNAATLILIALYIFYEGIQRLLHPEPVAGLTISLVALVALVLNTGIALALWKSSKHDLNVRSAFIHILGDALSSVGVILAGIATIISGWEGFDPAVSILIGLFILWSSWGIIKESTNILLEGIPQGLNMNELQNDIMAIKGVKSIHDLHVWTIGSNFPVLSCHILSENIRLQEANATIHEVKEMLGHKYDIRHATLELECESCEMSGPVHCSFTLDNDQEE
ncbi:MAG TPA: cation diffusion facilitator family transporter [Chloroflexia bacterium]|nr:cation diffusion facilitator family transporter [Chloroflexia bacterium]